eukprot:3569746-Pleurochrysis_carterae.AAC.1
MQPPVRSKLFDAECHKCMHGMLHAASARIGCPLQTHDVSASRPRTHLLLRIEIVPMVSSPEVEPSVHSQVAFNYSKQQVNAAACHD